MRPPARRHCPRWVGLPAPDQHHAQGAGEALTLRRCGRRRGHHGSGTSRAAERTPPGRRWLFVVCDHLVDVSTPRTVRRIMRSNVRSALMVIALLCVGCGKSEPATGQPTATRAAPSASSSATPRAAAPTASPAPRPPPPSIPPLASGVMLEVDTADFARSGASAIRGVTNLPDNTELVVSAEEPGDFGDSYSVSGTVRSGRFGGESASGDAAVPEGVYLIEVTMVSPGSQPEDV